MNPNPDDHSHSLAPSPAHSPGLHALLFGLAVLAIAVLAAIKARDYQPKVDHDVLNGRLAHAFETHYDHDFPTRHFCITLLAADNYGPFNDAQSVPCAEPPGWTST